MTQSDERVGARRRVTVVLLLAVGCFVVGFLVLGILTVRIWETTNSVDFCSNTCHDVHPEEPVAFQDSYHARVNCTECHMGRVSFFRAVAIKTTHARHLPAVLFGKYGRPLESESMRPANETCERCHSPSTFHDDAAREIRRFLPDEGNTELRTYLLLKTGTGAQKASQGYGIHWHISNPVEYIATDDHKQEIRWVRATLPDGRTVEYNDFLNPLSAEEMNRAEKRLMDCVDCHNRIGHPYRSPEKLIDQALAEGRLSPTLPFAKKEMLGLLSAEYVDQGEALAAADSLRTRYRETMPGIALAYEGEIEQAVQLAKELIPRLIFEAPGVTWESFSENVGHKTSPGCFRCHDGKHVSQDGEIIQLKCGLCHSIPATVAASEGPPEIPIASRQEPSSHLETTFVSDHRFAANDTCADCHGEIAYGADDSSFCANSACHGLAWPMVDLDAIYTHPIRLAGGHAEVRCYSCHQGESDISYKCATCHESPAEPHYGTACEDCHTPSGFQLASADGFLHPMDLEGKHEALGCGSCHTTAKVLTTECSTCHLAPENHLAGGCDTCHTPTGWIGSAASAVARGGAIPHVTGGGDDCQVCHDPAQQNWPAPPDHAGYRSEQCVLCHAAGEGSPLTVGHVQGEGLLRGSHIQVECVECHEAGVFQGTEQACVACHGDQDVHAGQRGEDCAQCHSPDGWQQALYDHTLSAFKLLGRHRAVACVQCHAGEVYQGTPQTCYACHQVDDQHGGQFGQNCAQCHTPDGWGGARIDHNATGFPLTGRHSGAACTQCHPNNRYDGTPQTCYACHQADDRHGGQFGQNCAQCHTPDGWGGARIDHNATGFPLTGRHSGAACTQCHPNNRYDGTPQNCYACHQADDRHGGQFGQNCAQCHTPDGWGGARIDHNATGFPLTGRHSGAACTQCHPNNRYDGTPRECSACHGEPAFHAGLLGNDCARCHSVDGWRPAGYDRPHTFPFDHGGPASCQTCHPDNLAGYTCFACHNPGEIDEEHREEGVSNYSNCVGCHPTGRED